MSHRRTFLTTLLGGAGALMSCRTLPRDAQHRGPLPSLDPPGDGSAFTRRFLEDFRMTSSRTYSEEGIPVFLVGENRVREAAHPSPPKPPSDPSAAQLALDLRRGASALSKAHLASSADDVGKLVEVLAEREFGHLTTRSSR